MPTITFDQLNGAGILNPDAFVSNETYNITIGAPTCSGSAYFTMEAVRDSEGFYDSFSAQPGKAKFLNFVDIDRATLTNSFLESPRHIWSIVVPPEGGTFSYVPFNISVLADTVFLRGTGGITFTYNEAVFVFTNKAQLVTAVDLWISNRTGAITLYGEINTWDVSAITDMSDLFDSKTTFNSDISNWNVSNVTDMTNMFQGATAFNSPINNWDVRKVTNISRMFNFANSFQQPLNLWDLNSLVTADLFMGSTGVAGAITYTLLDTLYNGWVIDFAALQPNVTIDFGDSTFTSAGLAAKNILVNNKGWTIFDGGQV